MKAHYTLILVCAILLSLLGHITASPIGTDLEGRTDSASQFGVAVDLCRDPNFEDCQRNIKIADMACYALDKNFFSQDENRGNGLSSVGFAGDMYCYLFTSDDCSTGKGIEQVLIFDAQPDLREAKIANGEEQDFDNRCYSMKCHRDS